MLTIRPSLSLELRSYHIDCDADEFDYILSHPLENIYIDCTLEYNDRHWDNVRIRLRGETSRQYPKKSYKVNFDADDRFFGRDKLNLISEYLDSSFCREFLAYDFYHRAVLPASGAWFTRLYVNDRYMGLYLDVEQIDEHFLRMTDLPDDASIYKADGNGSMLRTTDRLDGVMWQKKTNEETGYYDLARLIEWLDTTPDCRFFIELGSFFDPEELARVIAVNGILANTSTYYHNYYLIHSHGQEGRWHMLPWDLDITFYYRYNYGVPQFYVCGQVMLGTNILIANCWRDPEMRELIYAQMHGLVDSVFVEGYYQAMSDTLEDLLHNAVDEDSYKQFSIQQFINGVTAFPEIVAGRGARVLEKMEHYAVPFDLKPPLLTPNGIYLSWDSTFVPNDSEITYEILISHDVRIPPGDYATIENIEGLSLLYNDIDPGEYYYRVRAITSDHKTTWSLRPNLRFAIPEGSFDATIVTGTIEESTTWTVEGSPYSLPEGLTIAPNAVLTIEPGVLIGLGSWQSLFIEGGLTATGTRSDSIHIVPLNPDGRWRTIYLVEPTHPVRMNFVAMHGGYYLIMGQGGSLQIFDSSIRTGYRAVETHGTTVHIERVDFTNLKEEVVAIRDRTAVVRSCRFSHGPQSRASCDMVDFDDIPDLLVERCLFYTGIDDAIDIDRVHRGRIINNRIYGVRDNGISITGYRLDLYVANNIIFDCSTGMAIQNLSGVRLWGNVIAFCDTGITVKYSHDDGGSAYVRNTVLWRNQLQTYLGEGAEIDVAYSMISGDEPYPGDGNLYRNAYFIDQWSRNFELTERSTMIDAGYGTGHPPRDYYEAPRIDIPDVQNTGGGDITYVDIGAFEYGSAGDTAYETELPSSYIMLENYPNPFNSLTRIDFEIIGGMSAVIEIFDIAGRYVFSRDFRMAGPGHHSMLWDGRNDAGMRLASGIYFCRLTQNVGVKTIKMAMIK